MAADARARTIEKTEIYGSFRRGAAIHRTGFRLGAARQPLSADDRKGGARDARRRMGAGCRYYDTAPLYGLGLAETRLNGFLRAKPRDSVSDLDQDRPPARTLRARRPFASGRVLRDAVAPRKVRLFLRRRDALAGIFARAARRSIASTSSTPMTSTSSRMAPSRRRTSAFANSWRAATGRWSSCARAARSRRSAPGSTNGRSPKRWRASGDFDVFLLAGRYTLLEQEALESFLPYCVEKNIGVVIGGPFNSGILATGPKRGAFYNYAPATPGDPRPRRQDSGDLQGPWRQTGRGGAAFSARASRDRLASFPAARSRAKCAATPR